MLGYAAVDPTVMAATSLLRGFGEGTEADFPRPLEFTSFFHRTAASPVTAQRTRLLDCVGARPSEWRELWQMVHGGRILLEQLYPIYEQCRDVLMNEGELLNRRTDGPNHTG